MQDLCQCTPGTPGRVSAFFAHTRVQLRNPDNRPRGLVQVVRALLSFLADIFFLIEYAKHSELTSFLAIADGESKGRVKF
ncbi:hypothetical protein K438DRAFT_1819791, partial [Mycena galopus ATCC 62051]